MRNRDLEKRDSVESGLEAARTGKYEKAYNIWKPLADDGNPFARLNIGITLQESRAVR